MIDAPTLNVPQRFAAPRRAFTMIEILAVVCILGIIAAALVPPMGGNLYASRLRTAANTLAADIDFCGSECIAQPNAPRAISFSTGANRYSVINFSTGTVLSYPADSQPYTNDFATGRYAQLSGVTLQSVTSGGAATTALTFNSYGKPLLTSNLIITLAFHGATMLVTVNAATGDVTITGG